MQECDKECKQAGVFKTNNHPLAPSYFQSRALYSGYHFCDIYAFVKTPFHMENTLRVNAVTCEIYSYNAFSSLFVITLDELQDEIPQGAGLHLRKTP